MGGFCGTGGGTGVAAAAPKTGAGTIEVFGSTNEETTVEVTGGGVTTDGTAVGKTDTSGVGTTVGTTSGTIEVRA